MSSQTSGPLPLFAGLAGADCCASSGAVAAMPAAAALVRRNVLRSIAPVMGSVASSPAGDIAVREVRPALAVLFVQHLCLRQFVAGKLGAFGERIVVQPRIVLAEHRVLQRTVRFAERRIAVLP